MAVPVPRAWAHAGSLGTTMSSRRPRAALGAAVLLGAAVVAACGSAASTTSQASHPSPAATSTTRSTTTAAPTTSSASPAPSPRSAHRLEAALLANSGPPRAASASCRPATSAERAAAPFGHTARPVFVCLVGRDGHRDAFDVQVLDNGCFVAERTRPGQAIYGCGAGSAS